MFSCAVLSGKCVDKAQSQSDALVKSCTERSLLITDIVITALAACGVALLYFNQVSIVGLNNTALIGVTAGIGLVVVLDGVALVARGASQSKGTKEINKNIEPALKPEKRIDVVAEALARINDDLNSLIQTLEVNYPDIRLYAKYPSNNITGPRDAKIEYQKTLLAILSVLRLASYNYDAFVSKNQKEPKLTKESFEKLQQWFSSYFADPAKFDLLLNVLAFHDTGKLADMREQWGCRDEYDHDKALAHGLSLKVSGSGLECFDRLSEESKELVKAMWNTGFLGPQFVQGVETTFADIAGLVRILKAGNQEAVELMFLQELADLFGNLVLQIDGKPDYNGSVTFNENTFLNFSLAREVILKERDLTKKDLALAIEISNDYFKARGQDYGIEIDDDGSPDQNLACIKIGCALRLNGKDEIERVKQAFGEMNDKDWAFLIEAINYKYIKFEYLPDLLQAFDKHKMLKEGLIYVVKLYKECANLGLDIDKPDTVFVFNIAKEVAKDDFDPKVLEEFVLDIETNCYVKTTKGG